MGRRILIILAAFMTVSTYADKAPVIDRPKNMDKPSQEEKGILSTLVLIYTKTRNAVSFCYDEAMYFAEMRQNFKNMHAWFDRVKSRGEAIWDKSSELFTDPKNVFVTLDRMEDIFDRIDYAAWSVPRELDHIIAKTEYTYDKSVNRTKEYVNMIPNTDETIEYIDRRFGFSTSSSEENHISTSYKSESEKKSLFPEEDLVNASKLVAAASMSKSEMYRQWALRKTVELPNIEKEFSGTKGANGQGLSACWYTIEQLNANNKLLSNNLEELKVLQATLGIYVFEESMYRTQELKYKNDLQLVHEFIGQ